MHPPLHLSSPASATTTYAATYIQRYIHTLLAATGFHKSSKQAVQVLTEVLERYLLLLGSTAQKHSLHAGRTVATPIDVLLALDDVGSSCEDIRSWLTEDAADVAGRWLVPQAGDNGVGNIVTAEANAVAGPSSRGLDYEQRLPGVEALRQRNRYAKADYSDSERQHLDYEEIGSPRLQLLEDLFEGDNRLSTPALSEGSTDQHDESVKSPAYENAMQIDEEAAAERTLDRKGGSNGEHYDDADIPSFLPPLPRDTTSRATNGNAVDDAEHTQYIDERIGEGEAKSQAAHKGEAQSEATTSQPQKLEALTPDTKRSTQDLWQRTVPFTSSELATAQQADDLPAIRLEDGIRTMLPASYEARARSSVHAFANDYAELVTDWRQKGDEFLTPPGGAYSRVLDRRREIAAYLADPSKYTPCDTVFGSIGARPTALPFQPTSSLLVTPPTSTKSAPTFTAIEPNGRVPPSSTTHSAALYPACRHRYPGNVSVAAQRLTGGINTETYRRTTRMLDPPAITDEHHAERVFQGQPASRELLSDGHSFLKAAIDVLNAEHLGQDQEEEQSIANGIIEPSYKEASDDDYEEFDDFDDDDDDYGGGRKARNKKAKQRAAANSQAAPIAQQRAQKTTKERIKVKQGTIVATWDWLTRDYTDPQLPARKHRAGVAGVALGGPNSAADLPSAREDGQGEAA